MKRNSAIIWKESRVIPWLFSLSWEQRKLEEIVEFLDAKRKPIEEGKRVKGPYPYYGASGIVDFISDYLFDEELILLSEDGANITDRNYPICFLASGKYWVNNHAHVLKSKHGYDNNFICNAMERKDYANYNTGMAMPKLNQDVCRAIPILSPCYEEQKLIGIYFRALDNLITLHQRQGKPSLIDPFLMFQEYTSAWEQRKLGEIVGIYDGVHQTPDYQDEGIMFLSVENISTLQSSKFITEEAFERDYKVFPEQGDILMTRIGDVGTPNVVETSEKVAFYVSLALLKPRGNVDSYYLCNAILSPLFQKGLRDRTLLTAIPQKINKDEIGKVEIFVPVCRDEQEAIGCFFKKLNKLITLHQREYFKQQTEAKNVKYNQRDGPFL